MRAICILLAVLMVAPVSDAAPQQVLPPITDFTPKPPAKQQQAKPEPAKPDPAKPAQAGSQAANPEEAKPQAQEPQTSQEGFFLNFQGAPLTEVIAVLARRLGINYILDPRVSGSVTINTYGEIKAIDTRALLETVLRINNAAMVQVGNIYRIVLVQQVGRLPLSVQTGLRDFPDDERLILNLVFLKYATVTELSKLLTPFMGEGGVLTSYEPANLLLILDNSRNMKRTMELIAAFDNDALAAQRVRLFEVRNGRPADLARELEQVMRAVSLGGEKQSTVKFLPIDRINTLVAIAPNPGVFETVKVWLDKLDVPVKATKGTIENYVYRVKYGRADTLAMAIMQLYLGLSPYALYGGMYGGGMYPGMYGGGMYGGGLSSPYGAGIGSPYGGIGGVYGGMAYPGMMGGYPAVNPGMAFSGAQPIPAAAPATGSPTGTAGTTGAGSPMAGDLTGSYLGAAGYNAGMWADMPRVIPNPFDNTLLIHAKPQDYEQIQSLLRQLDVPPRQVLVEAQIYEVNLQGSFSAGVEAFLQRNEAPLPNGLTSRTLQGATSAGGAVLTAGILVGQSRQLLAILKASEQKQEAKLISAPRLIATDSVPASINVGDSVPTLAAQAVSGTATSGGSSLFAQSIVSVQTGVTLNVTARVNPSGIVTLMINQQVSAPVAPPANVTTPPSPSFSNRNVSTQVTVQDGDTIAIGGIIQESNTNSSAGVPLLHRIPILGAAFGAKSITKTRTELVILMTPRVIYDTNQMVEASEQLKEGLKHIEKVIPQ
jgi:general secretion pathway protein D